ncbi:MAG: PQQ-binding-like beta-propeller repeat protein [Sedimentisphaerales bacterium]|nr:PQQ-binding-like beta-propeller repeat protein [Sedimentisphaerales bacterium]
MLATRRAMSALMLSVVVALAVGVRVTAGADWPNYRGPNHDGISSETDWQSRWGDSGPVVLWRSSIGIGFATTAVANGRAYVSGNTGKDDATDLVFCFDAETGKEVWRHSYPCPLLPKSYEGGTLSTPTVDSGKVYSLSKVGDLFCLDAATGKVVWQRRLNEDMGFELPTWHFSSSGLIAGDMLIFNVGSAGLALNKNTGEVIWQNGKGKCGYATPVPFQMDGQPCLAIMSEVTLFAVRQADGGQLWQFPWKTKYEINAADPVVVGNRMLITSGYKHGCALLEIGLAGAKSLWQNNVMSMQINSPVVRDGYVYGFDENIFKCVRLDDGNEQWQDRGLGKGSLMMSADGRLIIMSEKGELVIAQADPQEFTVLARGQILPRTRCWTSPVLANGRIYARNANGDYVCVDVTKRGN